jgi:RNA recognition motif-containing protein
VTRISRRTSSQDLKDAFRKYGRIRNVSMKRSYAFVEFDDAEDAKYGKYVTQPSTE